MSRDPENGTTTQEINFWLNMELALANIEKQLQSPGVLLTLAILRNAKRFHATVSFLSDTGLQEASETVAKYNQLMRDFPLDELRSATTLSAVRSAILQIFNHLNKKLRVTPYPVRRALSLVECLSDDLNIVIRSIVRGIRLLNLDYATFEATVAQTTSIFNVWDDQIKEFTNIAREVTRKRSERFIPIRINARHLKTKERLDYIMSFRTRHEELVSTLLRVQLSSGPLDPLQEITEAYNDLRSIDILDSSEEGIANWNTAEKIYSSRTTQVENAIITMLRDLLATARTSSEMFRVFSKFNALLVRQAIRGAVQEYQTRLIDNVKSDITKLQDRFGQQYTNSEAREMFKLRDLPPVAGSIIWVRQIERQLDLLMKRVEDVLGSSWQVYAEGQKLQSESASFRRKLDTSTIYDTWLNRMINPKRAVSVTGFLFRITPSRAQKLTTNSSPTSLELDINFDPQIITLFKEVRNLLWLGFQVPHSLVTVAKDAKQVYPFAVSLLDSLQTWFSTLEASKHFSHGMNTLLIGYENAVFDQLSKGILLRWESFVHALDRSLLPGGSGLVEGFSSSSSRHTSRHVQFILDLDHSVRILKTKADDLAAIDTRLHGLLSELVTCPITKAQLSAVLGFIQDIVDKLMIEGYVNIGEIVEWLNSQIRQTLVTRCQQIIEQWVNQFNQQPIQTSSIPTPVQIRVHELVLKHQVISLQPPLELSRREWIRNLQGNIEVICTCQRIRWEKSKNSLQVLSSSFADISRTVIPDLINAYSCIDVCISQSSAYLRKWYQFQALWDLETNQVFDKLADDLAKWLAILSEIRRSRATFDTTENFRMFGGALKIEFGSVQSRISSKYDMWQHEVIVRFSQKLQQAMRDSNMAMEYCRRELEHLTVLLDFNSSSTEQAAAAVTTVEQAKSKIIKWEADLLQFRSGQTVLSRYRFQFPSDWLFIDHVENELEAVRDICSRRDQAIKDQIDSIRSRVSAEILRLSERVETIQQQWATEKPVSGTLNPKQALEILTRFRSEAEILKSSSNMLAHASEVLSLEVSAISDNIKLDIDTILEEMEDFSSVWGSLESVWDTVEDLRKQPWANVVPRKVRQTLESLIESMQKMPARVRQYSAFEQIQARVKDLSKTVALLTELKSEAMRERHWETLLNSDGHLQQQVKRVPYGKLSLGNVWDLKLLERATIIKSVVAEAQGELALEIFITQVREMWSNYALELINYKNKCNLIKGWKALLQQCGDHLNSLRAMHHSRYFKVFEEEARSWEDKLNRVHILFDTWVDVQRQWVYLDGVFNSSDNQSDIRLILPVESTRFQNASSEYFLVLRKVYKSPVVLDVVNIPGVQKTIDRLADLLSKIQKALGEYFEKERQQFARFYFIGDDDLLEIISNSRDISRVEKHLSKMFAGISGLLYDPETSVIQGIRSKEGEVVKLSNEISLLKQQSSRAIDWLQILDEESRKSISDLLVKAVEQLHGHVAFNREKLMHWIQSYPCQVLILSIQVYWTSNVQSSLSDSSTDELNNLKNTLSEILEILAGCVLEDLTMIDRKKCESLITQIVHHRDIVQALLQTGATSKSFIWLRQLTYHLDAKSEPLKRLHVRQANATFTYGFEYAGVPDQLVRTPLVDNCFLSMTQALDQKLGGSPFGPAGTGKTESVKSLGYHLGKFVLVFCCDESFDYQALGRILLGIAQVGAWGCFDEFNRLDPNILSAISSQVEAIEIGLRKMRYLDSADNHYMELIGRRFPLNPETGLFITMNPEYAGRNTLPENLKKLFRSFSMARPDAELIAEVLLISQGFTSARTMSRAVVPFFSDLRAAVSSQIHYDFGLRALKNVLKTSGNLNRTRDATKEADNVLDLEILVQSIEETVTPKLVPQDTAVMEQIQAQYFPDVSYQVQNTSTLRQLLNDVGKDLGYDLTEDWILKAMQLFRFQDIHHGIILAGPSGSGKSSVTNTLLKALVKLENIEGMLHRIDAKVLSKDTLFGTMDVTTREWTDGLLTSILRKIADNQRSEASQRHWIVFDGDVDPEWAENLNSVLDDNRLLTLPNGERIALPGNVRIIFEVENLTYATPATVSRCGMIWFSDTVVSPQMLMDHLLFKLKNPAHISDELEETMTSLLDDQNSFNLDEILNEQSAVIASVLTGQFAHEVSLESIIGKAASLDHIMTFSVTRSLSTFFALIKSAIMNLLKFMIERSDFPPTDNQRRQYTLKHIFLSLSWAFSGDCSLNDRDTFFNSVRDHIPDLPMGDITTLLDYDVSLPNGEYTPWIAQVPKVQLETHSITQQDLVVPTLDTVKHESLIYSLINDHKSVILCGPPGSGKTMTLFSALRKSPNLDVVGLNYSKATTPDLLIKSLEQHCEYRKTIEGIVLSPAHIGRWLVVFSDELNLPEVDKYGTQTVISLMRQMIEQNGFWSPRNNNQWITLSHIQFVGACNPPTDVGRSHLSLRFLRHTAVVHVDYPGRTSLHQIYLALNSAVLKCVPPLRGYAETITDAMIEVYSKSQLQFTAASQSHYIYSPRELTRWTRGIYEAIKPLDDLSEDGLVRIWAHEALRLFQDRLVTDSEKDWTLKLIQGTAEIYFPDANISNALRTPILYSNWLSKHYVPVELDVLKQFVIARMKTFCDEDLDKTLVLYDDLLEHVLRIDRVMRQPQGHMILIGDSGSGKVSNDKVM